MVPFQRSLSCSILDSSTQFVSSSVFLMGIEIVSSKILGRIRISIWFAVIPVLMQNSATTECLVLGVCYCLFQL